MTHHVINPPIVALFAMTNGSMLNSTPHSVMNENISSASATLYAEIVELWDAWGFISGGTHHFVVAHLTVGDHCVFVFEDLAHLQHRLEFDIYVFGYLPVSDDHQIGQRAVD